MPVLPSILVAIPSGQSKGMRLTPLSIGFFVLVVIVIVVLYYVRRR